MPNSLRLALIILFILVIVVAAVIWGANYSLNRQADQDARSILVTADNQPQIIQASDLEGLPAPVQKWMQRSGVVGKEKIHTVRLKQAGRMRTEPGNPWMPFTAEQYINVDEPAFVWKANVKAAPFVSIKGLDRYLNGQGRMQIILLGLFTLGEAAPGFEMNQGAMHRFMAEMIWYPSVALNDYISWEAIDESSARATMTWKGVSADMVFNFNQEGDLVSNIAPRYREDKGKFVLTDWGGLAREYKEYDGIRIFSKSDVIWKYETGDFNWLQLEVVDIDFNKAELY